MKHHRFAFVVPLGFVMYGCVESPQSAVAYEAVVIADPDGAIRAGDWDVRVTRADVALGPVYFCAAASGSSTLCESSIAEVAAVARLNGLDPRPQRLGRVKGFTGRIQSASYDFGISWFSTNREAVRSAMAPEGHSLHIEGDARRGSELLAFVADVDLIPQYQGQTSVPTASTDALVDSSAYRLEITFRVAEWLKQLDFDAIAASGKRPFLIQPGTPEHNAILVGVKNIAPPVFRWTPTQ